jgi:hypothetical protein
MEKILLHTCCAPCLAYPEKYFRENTNFEIVAYFYNPNIHPYLEFEKRKNTLEKFCEAKKIELITENYGLLEWTKYVRDSLDNRENRCEKCYEMRLVQTAKMAKKLGIKNISTTLLYSKYQYHEKIKQMGKKLDVNFFYHDFREGWQEGFDLFRPFKNEGLYQQNYCGCVFSEEERFNMNKKKRDAINRVSTRKKKIT